MRSFFRLALLLSLSAGLSGVAGCVIDRTGRSSSRELIQTMSRAQRDIAVLEAGQVGNGERLSEIEDRSARARQSLARSGATLDMLLEELQGVRGGVEDTRAALATEVDLRSDLSLRLDDLELRLDEIEVLLGVAPLIEPEGAVVEGATDTESSIQAEAVNLVSPTPEGVSELPPRADDEPMAQGSNAGSEGEQSDGPGAEDAGSEGPGMNEEQAFHAGLALLEGGRFAAAGSALHSFLQRYPDSPWAADAQFLKAESLYQLGEYAASITEYQVVVERFADSERAPPSMLKQGLAFLQMGQSVEAQIFLQELIQLFPSSEAAARAREQLEQLTP